MHNRTNPVRRRETLEQQIVNRLIRSVHVFAGLAVVLTGLATCLEAAEPSAQDAEFFEKSIRPLLVSRCFKCHGDNGKFKGGLRLTSRANVLKGGDSGSAAVVGKPAESLLVEAINYSGDIKMPPDRKLPPDEIALFTRWVSLGLPWPDAKSTNTSLANQPGTKSTVEAARQFWAFQPVQATAVPDVRNAAWPRSDLDRFILSRLEGADLSPAAPADQRMLIRRVTFDLTGLPPNPDEVTAFLADKSPDAFAKVVDRLLASPQYGERWGRHWLDVVRYTDSFDARIVNGDNVMECNSAWRYRDWVVAAFNHDLPYDEFIRLQLAGDIVGNSDRGVWRADRVRYSAAPAEGTAANGSQAMADYIPRSEFRVPNFPDVIATGLLAIGNWGGGDADKEKLLTDIVDDQIDVVSRGFLGVTLACARCHDHKFDPFTTEDYYGLAGMFFSSHILADVGPKTNGPPMLRIPLETVESKRQRAERDRSLAELQQRLNGLQHEQFSRLARQLVGEIDQYLLAAWDWRQRPGDKTSLPLADFARERHLHEFALRGWIDALGLGELRLLSQRIETVAGKPGLHGWKGKADNPSATVNTNADEVAFITIKMPPRSVAVHPSPSAGMAVGWRSSITGRVRIAGHVQDADSVCGNGIDWTVELRRGSNTNRLAAGSIPNGGRQEIATADGRERLGSLDVRAGDLVQFSILPKGDYSCDTTVVELAITDLTENGRAWSLTRDVLAAEASASARNPQADSFGHPDVWQFYDLAGSSDTRLSVPDGSALAKWFEIVNQTNAAPDRDQLVRTAADLRDALAKVVSPTGDEPNAKLLGQLTSPASPFWGQGRGGERLLPDDVQRELKSLAGELDSLRKQPLPDTGYTHGCLEGGCPKSPHDGLHDVKVHVRGRYDRLGELVSRRFPRVLAGDDQPDISDGSGRLALANWIASASNPLTARVLVNRVWLHHFGEGLVRTPGNFGKLGERPTHPELLDWLAKKFVESDWSIKSLHRLIVLSATYQQSSLVSADSIRRDPDNRLFGRMNRRRLDAESIRDSLLAVAGRLDTARGGPAVRDFNSPRRTLYLITIRSDSSSFRDLFDAADATQMVHQRTVSTVAPQSLFLMNDRFALDQTLALAQRIQAVSPDEPTRIRRLYELLYSRSPTDDELQIGSALLADRRQPAIGGDTAAAELAAWEQYCQVLLCANEFVFVD